jgi:hypothetical protein
MIQKTPASEESVIYSSVIKAAPSTVVSRVASSVNRVKDVSDVEPVKITKPVVESFVSIPVVSSKPLKVTPVINTVVSDPAVKKPIFQIDDSGQKVIANGNAINDAPTVNNTFLGNSYESNVTAPLLNNGVDSNLSDSSRVMNSVESASSVNDHVDTGSSVSDILKTAAVSTDSVSGFGTNSNSGILIVIVIVVFLMISKKR